MIIFLTSSPCKEGEANISADNGFLANLIAAVGPAPRGLFITAAPDDYGFSDYCASSMRHSLEISGLSFSGYQQLDRRTATKAAAMVADSTFIILGGGHVPTQNAFFREIGLKGLLKNFPGVIMGISAGTMNLAANVYAQPEEPGESGSWYQRFIPGLGLTGINVCPHLQKVRHTILDGRRLYEDITIPDSNGHCFYALPDGSYIMINGRSKKIFGLAYRIKNGTMAKICEFGQSKCIR